VKLAVMGGTFNPPHLGHLICAEEVNNHFKFDKVMFIPSARPPHKDNSGILDAQHRYMMTVLATQDNPRFEVSRIELDRPGRSYSIETVKQLQEIYGQDADIHWIVGADAILDMFIWKDVDELLTLCKFIAINRPGYDLSQAAPRFINKVQVFQTTNVDISATEIRRRVEQGMSIKYLVPSDVEKYIHENRLYRHVHDTNS